MQYPNVTHLGALESPWICPSSSQFDVIRSCTTRGDGYAAAVTGGGSASLCHANGNESEYAVFFFWGGVIMRSESLFFQRSCEMPPGFRGILWPSHLLSRLPSVNSILGPCTDTFGLQSYDLLGGDFVVEVKPRMKNPDRMSRDFHTFFGRLEWFNYEKVTG